MDGSAEGGIASPAQGVSPFVAAAAAAGAANVDVSVLRPVPLRPCERCSPAAATDRPERAETRTATSLSSRDTSCKIVPAKCHCFFLVDGEGRSYVHPVSYRVKRRAGAPRLDWSAAGG